MSWEMIQTNSFSVKKSSIWCLFLLVEGLQKPLLLHVPRLIAQVECLRVGYLHTNKGNIMSKVSWCYTLGAYSGSEYCNHFKSLSVITVNSKIEKQDFALPEASDPVSLNYHPAQKQYLQTGRVSPEQLTRPLSLAGRAVVPAPLLLVRDISSVFCSTESNK